MRDHDPATHRWRDVERELARARGARRALPFVAAAAAGAAAIAATAARSPAALALLLPGAVGAVFVWMMGVPRCPSCGGSLFRRGERPGSAGAPRPTEVERTRRCPRCASRFE
jgi:hypothetical protein